MAGLVFTAERHVTTHLSTRPRGLKERSGKSDLHRPSFWLRATFLSCLGQMFPSVWLGKKKRATKVREKGRKLKPENKTKKTNQILILCYKRTVSSAMLPSPDKCAGAITIEKEARVIFNSERSTDQSFFITFHLSCVTPTFSLFENCVIICSAAPTVSSQIKPNTVHR